MSKEICFLEIPQEFMDQIDQIADNVIKNLYSKFNFKYFHYITDNKQNIDFQSLIENFLFDYLINFKFIVYNFENFCHKLRNSFKKDSINSDIVDVVICLENECIIVDQIKKKSINQIFNKLKEHKILLLNVSKNSEENESSVERQAKEEIENFYAVFRFHININIFVKSTIRSILGYLIRRYFNPAEYYNDPSFFTFEQSIKNIKQDFTEELNNIFDLKNERNDNFIYEQFSQIHDKSKVNCNGLNKQEFVESDFISLRMLFVSNNASFYLVMHVESLYIFMMKKILPPNYKNFEHEIAFCEHYSYRCLTKFYGFLRDNGEIIGFIYEFLSNGSLNSFLLSNKHKISDLYSLMTINRIFQGLNYLRTNSLVHRDLKPSNILVDHDNIPYISDFDTIRSLPKQDKEIESFTNDIGSQYYSSPEQFQGTSLSFSTDVYSFGLIVYFIIEKRDLKPNNCQYSDNNDIVIPSMKNVSKNLLNLCESCIKFSPTERPTINEIEQVIIEEFNSFIHLEEFLIKFDVNELKTEMIRFFNECIILQYKNQDDLQKCFNNIFCFHSLFLKKFEKDHPSFLYELGNFHYYGSVVGINYLKEREYYEFPTEVSNLDILFDLHCLYQYGYGYEKDFLKAKQFYELAAKSNNSDSLNKLGDLYRLGLGVEQDYLKSKEYYELSSKLNNSDALNNLGDLYFRGQGSEKDYEKARYYYELSAQKGNSFALNNLGKLYRYGLGVEQNYSKAKEYFELASYKNNSYSLLNLATMYRSGIGVEKNCLTSKHYYELSAKLNNSNALLNLGLIYQNGEGVEIDFMKAKGYYEKSSQLNNSDAYCLLGYLYLNGLGVEKNILKAINYYELAGQLNNFDSYYTLGSLYYNGKEVKQDYLKAKEYFELAQYGNSDALLGLGRLYKNGFGVLQNYSLAIKYFELSAAQNNVLAFVSLGNIYFDGKGVDKNYQKAKEYFELAAQQQNIEAINMLSYIYYFGYGVEKDYIKSRKYIELSAQKNDSNALAFLGSLYYNGEGVDQNLLKAKEYYELAAKQNNPEALFKLGVIHEKGQDVDKDYFKAKEYYESAAKQNNLNGLYKLGTFYEKGKIVDRDYLKAIHYYQLAAQGNHSKAQFKLGDFYYNGLGVQIDYAKAKYYFKLSAEQNNSAAYDGLGNIYCFGDGIKQDYLKAKKYYELAARGRNKNALLSLGNIYFNGHGVDKNNEKALEYFKLGFMIGNDIMVKIGMSYHQGIDYKQDFFKAKKCYEFAANFNNPKALGSLGDLYYAGEGVEQNFKIAKYYYQLAAEQKDSYAFNNLGFFYMNGIETEQDYTKAYYYFKLSAKQNNCYGLNNLGNLYKNGLGVERDYLKAKECFELAAKKKYPCALNNLAYLYENGLGVEKDYLRAKYYYELAAQKNDSYALNHLGNMYHFGLGVKKDALKAKEYYELSSSQNNSSAFFNLGNLYYFGNGIKIDYIKAKYYYELSAKLDDSSAFYMLGVIYQYGKGVTKNYIKARDYYDLAAKKGNPCAFYFLGCLFSSVFDFEIDIKKAIHYFEKCIEFKNGDIISYSKDERSYLNYYQENPYYYQSYNDLGLIYITNLQDLNKGINYIKEAAFAEYPFSQNSLGLIYQFYLDNLKNAEYMYQRSAKHNFSLAYFNLAKLKEKNGNIQESIQYYVLASQNADELLYFHNHVYADLLLDISKSFIIILTNLILSEFYFSQLDFEESKKYFIKVFNKINLKKGENSYDNFGSFNSKYFYSDLEAFILEFPLYNIHKYDDILVKNGYKNQIYNSMSIFQFPSELFAYIIKSKELKANFSKEILKIIRLMKEILYTPPYCILFGRIHIEKIKSKKKTIRPPFMVDINELFYEGFGINI